MSGQKRKQPSRALVTGAAGFVGSHLVERLSGLGWEVVALDCLTPYYAIEQKRHNLAAIAGLPGVTVVDGDLRSADLTRLLDGVDAVFHQAGQPGVRASWDEFDTYVQHNIEATLRLLEAARNAPLSRFVYASSSSVYGNASAFPTTEDTLPRPQSPYGVTKLAAEHLCGVYARNFGVPTVSLRYFTVFGPRQRPDMAMHRLIASALTGSSFPLYGLGGQVRDFTYVGDVVSANVLAAMADVEPGTVVNIAGGGACTLSDVIDIVERLTGRPMNLRKEGEQKGDVERTGGDIARARTLLGWSHRVSVEQGLAQQLRWHEQLLGRVPPAAAQVSLAT